MATQPMNKAKNTVAMASIHRPGDEVVELPPGASADQLEAMMLKVIEMPDVGIQMATIQPPGDEVLDLPAGLAAEELRPGDFRVVDLE